MPDRPSRLELIDFLRGVAVLEMCITHFSGYLPPLADEIITYTETAMALFVILAGFIVGWELPTFSAAPKHQTVVLWKRAGRIAIVQGIIVLTLGVPLYMLRMPGVGIGESLITFLIRSMTLQNQIGLIHILPTFIPLFLLAPLVSWALARKADWVVLTISGAIFCVGHYHPYILDFGDPTVFPFVLFQFYFVIGCVLGKLARRAGAPELSRPKRWLVIAASVFVVSMIVVHAKFVPNSSVSIHPLNLFGLAYQLPIIATLSLVAMAYLPTLKRTPGYPMVKRFGRHALLAFVIHVYLAKAIGVANHFTPIASGVNYLLILASIAVMNVMIRGYEARRSRADQPPWVRVVATLFR